MATNELPEENKVPIDSQSLSDSELIAELRVQLANEKAARNAMQEQYDRDLDEALYIRADPLEPVREFSQRLSELDPEFYLAGQAPPSELAKINDLGLGTAETSEEALALIESILSETYQIDVAYDQENMTAEYAQTITELGNLKEDVEGREGPIVEVMKSLIADKQAEADEYNKAHDIHVHRTKRILENSRKILESISDTDDLAEKVQAALQGPVPAVINLHENYVDVHLPSPSNLATHLLDESVLSEKAQTQTGSETVEVRIFAGDNIAYSETVMVESPSEIAWSLEDHIKANYKSTSLEKLGVGLKVDVITTVGPTYIAPVQEEVEVTDVTVEETPVALVEKLDIPQVAEPAQPEPAQELVSFDANLLGRTIFQYLDNPTARHNTRQMNRHVNGALGQEIDRSFIRQALNKLRDVEYDGQHMIDFKGEDAEQPYQINRRVVDAYASDMAADKIKSVLQSSTTGLDKESLLSKVRSLIDVPIEADDTILDRLDKLPVTETDGLYTWTGPATRARRERTAPFPSNGLETELASILDDYTHHGRNPDLREDAGLAISNFARGVRIAVRSHHIYRPEDENYDSTRGRTLSQSEMDNFYNQAIVTFTESSRALMNNDSGYVTLEDVSALNRDILMDSLRTKYDDESPIIKRNTDSSVYAFSGGLASLGRAKRT